jgi:hypothetical protein
VRTIEVPIRNGTSVARVDFNAFHLESGDSPAQERGHLPIATANIEESGPRCEHLG